MFVTFGETYLALYPSEVDAMRTKFVGYIVSWDHLEGINCYVSEP